MTRAIEEGTGRDLWTATGLAFLSGVLLLVLGVVPAAAAPKAERKP